MDVGTWSLHVEYRYHPGWECDDGVWYASLHPDDRYWWMRTVGVRKYCHEDSLIGPNDDCD